MGIEFPSAVADLEFDGAHFPSVSVRYKGNGTFMGSRNALKRSMKLDLNDHVPGRKIGGATKINLHTCVTDPSWMNEVLSHKLFRDAGVPAPRTAYAKVELTVPGKYDRQYVGLYSIVENVDNSFAQDRFGTKKGALFKPVTRQLFEDLGDDWSAYRQMYDPKTPVSDEETGRVIAFSKLVSHASDAEFAARISE
jgi:spore coat protein CotH